MKSATSPRELESRIEEIDWFHSIDLGNGVITPGKDDSKYKLSRLALPERFDGKSVLDIGAWDGYFSFEAEKRGAKRVLSVDSYSWSGKGWGTKSGFELARSILNSNVEDREIEVYDLSPENVGVFDTVFFLGVFYHLRNPLRALECVSRVTKEMLILETFVDELKNRRPAMAYYPGTDDNADPTSWWGPNVKCVEAMLKTVGFKKTQVVSLKKHRGFPSPNTGRVVIHGWK
jgi:tRNA (mo5U34)-methyltransferase